MQVTKLQNILIEAGEIDKTLYQKKTMSFWDTKVIFRHLKNLKKSLSLPKLLVKDDKSAFGINEKVFIENDFFWFMYLSREIFKARNPKLENLTLTNFSVSRKGVYQFLIKLDVKKSAGIQIGIHPSSMKKQLKKSVQLCLFSLKDRTPPEDFKKLQEFALSRQPSRKAMKDIWRNNG